MNSGAAAGGRRDSVPGAAEDPANQGYDMQASEAPTAQAAPVYAAATTRSDAAQGQQVSLEGNMAELLEAAAKATTESQRRAAAQQQQQQLGGGLRKVARNTDLRGTAMQEEEEEVLAAGQKRKRTTSPDGGEAALESERGRAGSQSPRKRARQTPEVHSHTPMAHTPMSGADHHGHYHQIPGLHQQQHQTGLGGITPDSRAVGVHSAAALFRTPSTGSGGAAKKHTRPPMSKLFASLQLTPENFLRLQAAAKQYMLDEAHPERQSCVGSRGKGDTDMVKLRLFNCCRDFLSDGIGERFFGPDVPAPTENEVLEGETTPGRKWVWPRDGNKIVSLVTPLLRRMVTNERQRQYAQETRKGGSKKKDPSSAQETSQESLMQQTAATPTPTAPFNVEQHSPPNPAIDPALATPQPVPLHPQIPAQPQPSTQYGPPPTQYPRFLQAQPPSSIYSTAIPPSNHFQHHTPPDQNVIQILITKNNTKLLPRIDMPSWPSTPHHTLPLSDLRKAVEEEVKGFLKRGLDLGIRRRSMSAAGKTSQEQQSGQAKERGDGGAEGQDDVDMEGADEAQKGTFEEPAQQQQEQPANDRATTVSESGKKAQQQTDVRTDDPSLEGITLEIRALTGRGLVLITGEDEWRAVLAEVGRAVWMEGVLRVVVEVI